MVLVNRLHVGGSRRGERSRRFSSWPRRGRTVNRLKQLEDGLAAFAKIVGVSPQQLVNQSTWQWDDMAKTFLIAHRLCSHRIDLDSVANGLRSALDHVEAVACQFKADALSAAELRS
jgi:hypothetical protein